jgi:hypothetical protein
VLGTSTLKPGKFDVKSWIDAPWVIPTGGREQAQEHFTTATTMYREMGMTYWLEQAETEAAGRA